MFLGVKAVSTAFVILLARLLRFAFNLIVRSRGPYIWQGQFRKCAFTSFDNVCPRWNALAALHSDTPANRRQAARDPDPDTGEDWVKILEPFYPQTSDVPDINREL